MTDIQLQYAAAQKAFDAGEYGRASTLLGELIQADPAQPAFYHLTGRVLKAQGLKEHALRAIGRGIQVDDTVPALHADFASILADLGHAEKSIESYDRAIELAPDFLDAQIDRAIVRHKHIHSTDGYKELMALNTAHPDTSRILLNLGIVARTLGELTEAQGHVDRLLEITPDNFKGLRLRAQLALDRGLPSVALFRKAREVNQNDLSAISGEASALLADGEQQAAAELLNDTLHSNPAWNAGHQTLAQVRWQSGDADGFTDSYREALAKQPKNNALWADLAIATGRAIGHDKALPIFAEARAATGDDPYYDSLEANALCELGEMEKAGEFYAKLEQFDDPVYRLPLIRYCLKQREFERASEYGVALVEKGQGPDAWPYLSIAWRMLEDPRWNWLEGDHDLGKSFDLNDLVPELPAIAEHLRSLHRWQVHPFEQTLRGGTQTENVLFTREEAPIRALVKHIRGAVADYISQLPAPDNTHPVLSMPRGDFRFTGSWSVRLSDSGFHVSHIHNQGWISSALYIALPDTIGGKDNAEDGWLALGEPPAEFGLDLEPLKMIEPKLGRLALFPSIMWHGTRPFSAGERLTVAFDVAPNG